LKLLKFIKVKKYKIKLIITTEIKTYQLELLSQWKLGEVLIILDKTI